MTTFEAYRSSSLPNDIYNPMANIYAAVNYAEHTYGPSLERGGMGMGSGHGYDEGGWLMPGKTLAVNNTGQPERVVPPGRAGGAGVTVNFNGVQFPSPEQVQALSLALSSAVGVAG